MHDANWISVETFGAIASLPERTARYHLSRAANGTPTRKYPAMVARKIHGRGGLSGTSYKVLLQSLPLPIQAAYHGVSEASKKPLKAADRKPRDIKTIAVAKWRYSIIEAALAFPAGSSERAAQIRVATRPKASERTIERWIGDFEREGLAGLMRAQAANAGKPRVVISERFDAAFRDAGCDPLALPELSAFLDLMLRSYWASQGANAGDSRVGDYAGHDLREECERRGFALPPSVFVIPPKRINKWRGYAVINTKRTDAKRAKDGMATIERDWSGYDARSIIVIDVHHIKVAVTRADGSTAWPKLVGYFDPSTQMIFPHLVLCEERRSIRQEHVLQGILRLATDPYWGFPQTLYIDNGSENGALERLVPALEMFNQIEGGVIRRAIPHNANAKPIEPLFKRLNCYVFSQMKGFGGSARSKKTQNVGKALIPFQGTWDEFQDQVKTLIAAFHTKPIGGKWGNKSPDELFQEKIDNGWRPVLADELALDASFCDRVTRQRGRDGIVFGGQRYSHDQLLAVPKGTEIEFCMPWRAGEAPIALIPDVGPVKLLPSYAWAALDKDGARAAGQLRKVQKRAIRNMEADTVLVDPVDVAGRIAARAVQPILPGRAHRIDHGSAIQALADGRARAAENHEIELTDAERARARRLMLTEAMERNRANAA